MKLLYVLSRTRTLQQIGLNLVRYDYVCVRHICRISQKTTYVCVCVCHIECVSCKGALTQRAIPAKRSNKNLPHPSAIHLRAIIRHDRSVSKARSSRGRHLGVFPPCTSRLSARCFHPTLTQDVNKKKTNQLTCPLRQLSHDTDPPPGA